MELGLPPTLICFVWLLKGPPSSRSLELTYFFNVHVFQFSRSFFRFRKKVRICTGIFHDFEKSLDKVIFFIPFCLFARRPSLPNVVKSQSTIYIDNLNSIQLKGHFYQRLFIQFICWRLMDCPKFGKGSLKELLKIQYKFIVYFIRTNFTHIKFA